MNQEIDVILPNDTSDLEDGDYVIFKQKDGNYKGWARKNGKTVMAREVGPETVLQKLITHE